MIIMRPMNFPGCAGVSGTEKLADAAGNEAQDSFDASTVLDYLWHAETESACETGAAAPALEVTGANAEMADADGPCLTSALSSYRGWLNELEAQ
jgi:hypothetical protein